MPSLYKSREDRLRDVIIAKMKVDSSLRYSLTEGGRLLPFSDEEKQLMRDEQVEALARLAIDKAMQF